MKKYVFYLFYNMNIEQITCDTLLFIRIPHIRSRNESFIKDYSIDIIP